MHVILFVSINIETLRNIWLQLVYELCRDEAKKHRSKIMETLVYPLGVSATIDEDGHSHFQQV